MTLLVDIPSGKEAGPFGLDDLRARLAPMLADGTEARLVTTHNADVLAANAPAQPLLGAFKALSAAVRRPIIAWLVSASATDFEIKLPIDGQNTAYVLHAIKLDIGHDAPLFLIVARQPNLSSHLIQALSQSRALYKDIVETIPGLVWETRADGCFSFISGSAIPGLEHTTMVDETPASALGIPEGLAAPVFLSQDTLHAVDLWVNTVDGDRRCLSVSAKPLRSKGGIWLGARGIALDVTNDRLESDAADHASQRMINTAQTDDLTQLFNRRGFYKRLEKICTQIRSADKGGYLAVLDLDRFKLLNDTHGHQKGDEALQAVAKLLDRHTRREDVAARLGGDEFTLWIDNAMEEGVHRICQNLIHSMPALCEDIGLPGFGLSMSIGVTKLRPGQDTAETIMQRADKTMYAVKNAGRSAYLFDDTEADTWA